jgi:cyclic-di-GMP-binding protein
VVKLGLALPPFQADFERKPETRPARVATWLEHATNRDVPTAARLIGDSLAALNRLDMGESRRGELVAQYWKAAQHLWTPLSREFIRAPQPLRGEAQDAARAAITLAAELSNAYKRMLETELDKRISLGGARLQTALVRRSLHAGARVLSNSYLSYSPVPPQTWHDLHAIYAFARSRNLHQAAGTGDAGDAHSTPEQIYVQSLLLALANPYGLFPNQIETAIRYLAEHSDVVRLTDVAPVHRMARAVAIVPIGHDFPPFSANKGGAVNGSKLFLLTFDLAFKLQEQIRTVESGGEPPDGFRPGATNRARNLVLLRRLLRQWAIPPARQFSRLPSRGRVVALAGFLNAWHGSRVDDTRALAGHPDLPPPTTCQILNQTPGGYALRQIATTPSSLRIGDLITLRVEGKPGLQTAIVRWFRNAPTGTALEFGCELVSDSPRSGTAAAEDAVVDRTPTPVVVLPGDPLGPDATADQVIVPNGAFGLEHAIGVWHDQRKRLAVLTKLVDHGPDYEIYEFAPVD